MSEHDRTPAHLAPAIADLYRGGLADFVTRRDAFARELRSAGKRDEAARIKRLRKPTRLAWALDVAAGDQPDRIERLAAAVEATLAAQAGGGDVRAALAGLRDVVQRLATAAAAAATEGGVTADHAELANAIMAVIAVPGAFERLRAGWLADIPEAGGLDFLAGPIPSGAAIHEGAVGGTAQESASRAVLRQAEMTLAAARERAAAAERALRMAETIAETAERKLLAAQQEALAKQAERERAREEAEQAAADVREAERAATLARNRADDV